MPHKGFKMSEKSKEKMRQAKLKNPVRYWLGKHLSKEHFKKLHEARLKKAPKPRLGKTFTEESKKKISETLKKKFKSGELISPLRKLGLIGLKREKAMNWQGGKSFIGQNIRKTELYKKWRQEVLKSWNFTCALCYQQGGKLEADHFPVLFSEIVNRFSLKTADDYMNCKLLWDVTNGRILCKACHKFVTDQQRKMKDNSRRIFIEELTNIAKQDKDIILIVGDVGFSYIESFAKIFPDQFINAGVTEQSFMGMAAGLALSGKKPWVYSMIPFVLFRNAEQVRNDIVCNNANVKLIGVLGGLHYSFLGVSHNLLHPKEDINFCKNIGLDSYIPKDNEEVKKVIKWVYESNKPAYIRI